LEDNILYIKFDQSNFNNKSLIVSHVQYFWLVEKVLL